MKRTISHCLAASTLLLSALGAQAATTTLTFSELVDLETSLEYSNTVGGDLTVTADGGKLVIVAGELGVLKKHSIDARINGGESITFSFDDVVQLSYWDMDDLNLLGSNKFSLSVDGGSATKYSLDSHGPGSLLTGTTFTFGYKGDAYFIDTLKFSSVPAVPEPGSVALVLAGLGIAGLVAHRRRAG